MVEPRGASIAVMKHSVALLLVLACASCAVSPERAATELRVLSYNIKHGYGNDGKIDISRAAEVIRRTNADLVVLQEIDNGALRSGSQDQMAMLGELTGLRPRFGAFMAYQGGHYGMGLLSRFPIVESQNHILPEGAEPRSSLDARVQLPNGDELILTGVHFYSSAQERLAQATKFVDVYADNDVPMIVGGDFNSKPGSVVMNLMEQHWSNTDKGEDRFTMSATDPRAEIDFILYRPESRFEFVSIDVIDEPLVSDHRPVLMVIKLHPRHDQGD